jgi:hypothetical protein
MKNAIHTARRFLFRGTAVLFLTTALLVTGCDLFGNAEVETGRIQVLLVDDPLEGATAANVTITRVELIGADDGPVVLSSEEQAFNLLLLQDGVSAVLADLDVEAGRYSQMRVHVAREATLEFGDEESYDLTIPSGTETGIKILVPLEIPADGLVQVTLDFDVYESFVPQGHQAAPGGSRNFIFRPVIKPIVLVVNGEEVEIDEEENE